MVLEKTFTAIGEKVEAAKVWKPRAGDTERRRYGEPIESAEIRTERMLIIFGWILICVYVIIIGYFMQAGWIPVLIIIASIPVAWFIDSMIVKIPTRTVFVVELFEHNIDRVRILQIPYHVWDEYEKIGCPPQLIDKNSGQEIWLANEFNEEDKVLRSGWTKEDQNLYYLSHKEAYKDLQKKYLIAVHDAKESQYTIREKAQKLFLAWILKAEKWLFYEPSEDSIGIDYGQDREIAPGVKKRSVMSSDEQAELEIDAYRSEIAKLEEKGVKSEAEA